MGLGNPKSMWKIIETQDGSHSILSEEFGVPFHSKYGAIQESRHVFIEAGLFFKSPAKKKINILEMGFGTGLNAYLTFLEASKLQLNVHYTAVENFPLPLLLAFQLNYSTVLQAEEYQDVFEKLHEAPWNKVSEISPDFLLEKKRCSFENVDFPAEFDLIYLDAFTPDAFPQHWEKALMEKMKDALLPGGALVTYVAKGAFKRMLKEVGFSVEALQGPPGKREMTRAIKQ